MILWFTAIKFTAVAYFLQLIAAGGSKGAVAGVIETAVLKHFSDEEAVLFSVFGRALIPFKMYENHEYALHEPVKVIVNYIPKEMDSSAFRIFMERSKKCISSNLVRFPNSSKCAVIKLIWFNISRVV